MPALTLRLLLLVAVAGSHVAYYAAPEGSADRGWISYVGTHALVCVALLYLLPSMSAGKMGAVGALACWWGIVESAQAVGCSALAWGSLSSADLCEQAFSREVYMIAAALAIAWWLAGRFRRG
jgi:hypothetical protein